jgi:hypothetical protein
MASFDPWALGAAIGTAALTAHYTKRLPRAQKWMAYAAVISAWAAVFVLAIAAWSFVTRSSGDSKNLVTIAVSVLACLFFCIVSVRSFLGLRKSQFPT